MTEAFLDWWREHYSMANLAMGAASDAWDAATATERERCAKIAGGWRYQLDRDVGILPDHASIAAAIRTPSTGEEQ